jgi:uncharacterized protein YpbB
MESIILTCLKQLNGERTIYSIYHLLKGKKTSQTIQDAHLFELTQYFGAYHWLTREALEVMVKTLLDNHLITPCADQRFRLTIKGEDILSHIRHQYPAPIYLNGLKYHQSDMKFWERLSLLVQVISNLVHQETHYIPIQKNKEAHSWLKSFLKKNKLPRNVFGRTLYSELVELLKATDLLDPSILIFRLTGNNRIGQTSHQTAEMLNMEFARYHLEFLNILHYVIDQVTSKNKRFPLLSAILENTRLHLVMTNSAYKTYELLKKGYSTEEIAKYRRLKTSTIEDHIVEIALNVDDFSIDAYIDKQIQKRILAAAQQTASKQLKLIRSEVSSANYFEIRLVLAKYGVKQWN